MKFIERYLNGEDGQLIYEDIYNLNEAAFSEPYFDDVQAVLTETFNRVVFNLNIIYHELNNIGYAFKTEFGSNSDRPRLTPLPNTDELIAKLDNTVKEFGKVPLSLKLFYKIVGTCDFAWDYHSQTDILWEEADPIQIDSLDDVVSYVVTDDWKEYNNDLLNDDEIPALELAPDYLHKDNISGGTPYSIQLTEKDSIDSLFLNEPNETTFINYLRICMENCGFPGTSDFRQHRSFKDFFVKVKPQLKDI